MTFAASVTATTGALTGAAGTGFLSGAGSALGGSAAAGAGAAGAGAGSGIMGSLGGMFGGDLAGMGGLMSGGSQLLGGLFGSGGSSSSSTATETVGPFKSNSGLGRTAFDGKKNVMTLDPRFLQAQNQFLGQSGVNIGQLGAFNNNPFQASQPFDLQQTTQDQFNLLEGLQQGSRDQASQDLEERLFAQGRLGSTGGTGQQSSLQDQFRLQQAQNMQSAFGQGLQGQQQQFGQDAASNQQRLAQQQLLSSLGQGFFNSSLAPEELLMRQHQTAGSFAPITKTEESSSSGGGGLFSDKRLKDNIVKVGELANGLNIYKWDWNEVAKKLVGNQPSFGVLAQEVAVLIPNAVVEVNGILKVKYEEIM